MKENIYLEHSYSSPGYAEITSMYPLNSFINQDVLVTSTDRRNVTPINMELITSGFCDGKIAENSSYDVVRKKDRKSLPFVERKKRLFDIIFALAVILAGFPLFVIIYLTTKLSSPGPAIFRQERLGRNGQPFCLYKFRSMRTDAEKAGPQLSSASDPRITKWGRVIRRTRLDELPQFWNVLKGDMTVVGPRPERAHFAAQISAQRPEYVQLQRLRPGLTSPGQVYYGYAENVDQMCTRLNYDMKYSSQAGLRYDLKIILKTVKVMAQGKGK